MCGSSGFEWPCCVCLQTRLGPGPRQQGRQVQEAGFPPGTKWRAAAGRSAQAQRGRLGCLLSRARDGVPQQACFPWLCAERMNALGEGVAGRNGPLRRVSEDGSVIAGWRLGGSLLPLLDLLSLLLFFKRCRGGKQGKNGRGTHQGQPTSTSERMGWRSSEGGRTECTLLSVWE